MSNRHADVGSTAAAHILALAVCLALAGGSPGSDPDRVARKRAELDRPSGRPLAVATGWDPNAKTVFDDRDYVYHWLPANPGLGESNSPNPFIS